MDLIVMVGPVAVVDVVVKIVVVVAFVVRCREQGVGGGR